MTLPDSPVTHTGRVLRSWHTPTSTGAELLLSSLTHLLVYGPLPPVTRGATLKVTGTLNRNGSLDLQHAERLIPAREIAFTFYTRAPGLGGAAAAAAVAAFGDDTHDTIRTHPGVLRHTKGVSPSAARSLSKFARNKHRLYVAMTQLAVQGLPPEHAWPLLYRHGAAAPTFLAAHPYHAVLLGTPLPVLDDAAKRAGLSLFNPRRNAALVGVTLQQAATQHGHTCLSRRDLAGVLRDEHALDEMEIETACLEAVNSNMAVPVGNALYHPAWYQVERRLARDVARLLATDVAPLPAQVPAHLTAEQAHAVHHALRSGLMVLTGGPGTGKTTTLKAIIDSFEQAGLTPILCAPTGKAAFRMTQSTGRPATTLHRLLKSDGKTFHRKGLLGQVFILDEISMCSSELLSAFLHCLEAGTRVILVGDEDQLPPIDPGFPLAALIQTVPTARLTQTQRQAAGSPILKLAQQLISGEAPNRTGVPFHAAQGADEVAQLASRGARPMVLTAGKTGPLGVIALNAALQAALNPGEGGLKTPGGLLRVGDPLLITKNNHASGLMNGMTGQVEHIVPANAKKKQALEVHCLVEGEPRLFSTLDLPFLTPAYAITIHRAQGSEWPHVIVVLSEDHELLLTRQLAYTAVTRAKESLIACGSRQAWGWAAETPTPPKHSRLLDLLRA
jgi:exodeoxyribonuclease V alpha subunit